MNLAEARYKDALKLYQDSKADYDSAYKLYEPFIGGIAAARTRYSNDFITGLRIDETAWNILNVSRDTTVASVVNAPSNPSVSQLDGLKATLDGRKKSYWLAQLDFYSCNNESSLSSVKLLIANELNLKI